jgi:GNAT superfamily N-acetyltransferase
VAGFSIRLAVDRDVPVLLGLISDLAVYEDLAHEVGQPGLYLEDLFVKPEWRGRGFGTQLLRHLAQVAVDRGYGRMEWSVLDWNEPALRVYRRAADGRMDRPPPYRRCTSPARVGRMSPHNSPTVRALTGSRMCGAISARG